MSGSAGHDEDAEDDENGIEWDVPTFAYEGEENQPFEKKDRTANGNGNASNPPSAASA